MKNTLIIQSIKDTIETKKKILEQENILIQIEDVAKEIINAFHNNRKVLLCGNGGSAADAQHIAAELSGRFQLHREPLFAEALTVNPSYLTAIANDYSFEEAFARLVKAMGRPGDVLIGISTSGDAKNVIKAMETANDIGMVTVGLTGESGGKMQGVCNYLIKIPSASTPRIQESHILIGHIICEIVEKTIFV